MSMYCFNRKKNQDEVKKEVNEYVFLIEKHVIQKKFFQTLKIQIPSQSSLKYLILELNLSSYTTLVTSLGTNTRNKRAASSTSEKCPNITYNFQA